MAAVRAAVAAVAKVWPTGAAAAAAAAADAAVAMAVEALVAVGSDYRTRRVQGKTRTRGLPWVRVSRKAWMSQTREARTVVASHAVTYPMQ